MSCISCNSNPCCCAPAPCLPAPAPVPTLAGVPQCSTVAAVVADTSIAKFCELISCFAVPVIGGNISVSIQDSDDWDCLINCCVLVKDPTQFAVYRVDQVDSALNTLTLSNQGYDVNPAAGTVFADPCYIIPIGLCPSVGSATDCAALNILTDEAFNIPAVGATTNVKFVGCLDVEIGQKLFIEALGVVEVTALVAAGPPAELTVQTLCIIGSAVAGNVIPSGSYAVTSDICVITDASIQGTGSVGDPLSASQSSVVVVAVTHAPGDETYIYVDDDAAGGVVTINLRDIALVPGKSLVIKKLGSTANVVIDGFGAQTIDGGPTATLTVADQSITIHTTGVTIVGNDWNVH